jgi:xanthine dehydrogenase accessory factor
LAVIWDFETTSKNFRFHPLPNIVVVATLMGIIAKINNLLVSGETFCLATVIASDAADITPGSKVIVHGDGTLDGSIGSENIDLGIPERALAALSEKKSRIAEIDGGIRVFFNVLSAEARLLICGAGHIAIPLARFAKEVGFNITVLDDRSDFAHPSRFPDCTTIVENFTIALRDLPLGPSTYVVIITRGHEHDMDCLMEILAKDTAYVGLIGSRRRVSFVLQGLEEKGLSRQRLKSVFTPIGIPIGAESPAEIALSIVSELVCVRRKGGSQARTLRSSLGIE